MPKLGLEDAGVEDVDSVMDGCRGFWHVFNFVKFGPCVLLTMLDFCQRYLWRWSVVQNANSFLVLVLSGRVLAARWGRLVSRMGSEDGGSSMTRACTAKCAITKATDGTGRDGCKRQWHQGRPSTCHILDLHIVDLNIHIVFLFQHNIQPNPCTSSKSQSISGILGSASQIQWAVHSRNGQCSGSLRNAVGAPPDWSPTRGIQALTQSHHHLYQHHHPHQHCRPPVQQPQFNKRAGSDRRRRLAKPGGI